MQVQSGIYTGPFMLKQLIEKNNSLSACMIDQLQQPMSRGQQMEYVQDIKSFITKHKLNMAPFPYRPIPTVTSGWPTSISGSLGVDEDLPFLKMGSPCQFVKLKNHQKLNSNEAQWRSSNRPPQVYQQLGEWLQPGNLDRDSFAFMNVPTRQSPLLDNHGITPSCMYSSRHMEQPIIDLNSFGRTRCQNLHQRYDKQYKQTEINRNMKQKGNNSIFQGQVCYFLLIQISNLFEIII